MANCRPRWTGTWGAEGHGGHTRRSSLHTTSDTSATEEGTQVCTQRSREDLPCGTTGSHPQRVCPSGSQLRGCGLLAARGAPGRWSGATCSEVTRVTAGSQGKARAHFPPRRKQARARALGRGWDTAQLLSESGRGQPRDLRVPPGTERQVAPRGNRRPREKNQLPKATEAGPGLAPSGRGSEPRARSRRRVPAPCCPARPP